jgi:hypothetical protein
MTAMILTTNLVACENEQVASESYVTQPDQTSPTHLPLNLDQHHRLPVVRREVNPTTSTHLLGL